MIRPIAFVAGVALAWCGNAEGADFECGRGLWTDSIAACDALKRSTQISRPEAQTSQPSLLPECSDNTGAPCVAHLNTRISTPEDAVKVEINDLKERVTQLEGLLKALLAFLPDCTGEPPEHLPCIERNP